MNNKEIFSSEEYRKRKSDFLNEYVFFGLENINDGFDAESIAYFSKNDFEIVLNRVEALGIGIFGIEPWLNGVFFDVLSADDYNLNQKDSNWYRSAFKKFVKIDKPLVYAATYDIPDRLLNKMYKDKQ